MIPARIRSKSEYYDLAKFGLWNRFRSWDGIDEWVSGGSSTPIRFRSKIPGSRIFTMGKPYETAAAVLRAYSSLLRSGATAGEIVFAEPAPEEFLLFQGEFLRVPRGVELTWSNEPGITMREALSRARYSSGLSAIEVMKFYMGQDGYEQISSLADDYDAVVEFSTYGKRVGILGSRTVVWEIRSSY